MNKRLPNILKKCENKKGDSRISMDISETSKHVTIFNTVGDANTTIFNTFTPREIYNEKIANKDILEAQADGSDVKVITTIDKSKMLHNKNIRSKLKKTAFIIKPLNCQAINNPIEERKNIKTKITKLKSSVRKTTALSDHLVDLKNASIDDQPKITTTNTPNTANFSVGDETNNIDIQPVNSVTSQLTEQWTTEAMEKLDEDFLKLDYSNLSVKNTKLLPRENTNRTDNNELIISHTDKLNEDTDISDIGLIDAPENDPLIIDNAPLNVNNIGTTFLSADDTETLNLLVMLKCNKCLELVQCSKVEPLMKCTKCGLKYQFQCKKCTSGFISLPSLYTHLIKFHSCGESVHNLKVKPHYVGQSRPVSSLECDPLKIYNCQKCGVGFKLKTIKDKHQVICSRNPKLICPFCGIAMSFKRNMKEHMIKYHAESFAIEEIDSILHKIFKDGHKKSNKIRDTKITASEPVSDSAISALAMFQSLQIAYCSKCDSRTLIHELPKDQTTCSTCSESFIYACGDPQCPRSFSNAESLSFHVSMLHIQHPEPHHCAHCEYMTARKMILIKHQQICGNSEITLPRVFMCPDCEKTFRLPHYLRIHRRAGNCSRNKPVLVCTQCNRSFRQQRWLRNHRCEPDVIPPIPIRLDPKDQVVPRQEQEFACPDCGKTFKQMRWFLTHQKQYCDKQCVIYRCAHCRYKSFDKSKLKVHLRCAHIQLYTGKKLRCSKCGTKWASIYSLNRHLDDCSGNNEIENAKRRRKKKPWGEIVEFI